MLFEFSRIIIKNAFEIAILPILVIVRPWAYPQKFKFSDPINQRSGAFATYNSDNAKLAVLNVREMITELCTLGKFPMPNWLGKPSSSGGYWDDTFQDTGIDFYDKKE